MTQSNRTYYRNYLIGFKSEVIRRLSPVIGTEYAYLLAREGYIYQPGDVNTLYKLFLIPEISVVYAADHGGNKIPSPGDRYLQLWDLCIGADFDVVHEIHQNSSMEFCQICRTKAISDFAAAYLLIRADERKFITTANWTDNGYGSFSYFSKKLGNGMLPLRYKTIMPSDK